MASRPPQGLIIGRFQPFHNEHLAYALAAKARCEFLWVGLSRSELVVGSGPASSPDPPQHRALAASNPLNYCERYTLVCDALAEAGLARDEFGVAPCPIDHPELIENFIPKSVTCYITINEEWGKAKVAALRAQGYAVEVLWEKQKGMSGSGIRQAIRDGDPVWRRQVPPSVAGHLDGWGLAGRLRSL